MTRRSTLPAAFALTLVLLAATALPAQSNFPGTIRVKTVFSPKKFIAMPADIPHNAGVMIDRRILPDLRYLNSRFKIYVTEGYAGPLPSGREVGCRSCHVGHSDHFTGAAVDIVPVDGSARCDASWKQISKLAKWVEPRQNVVRAPFRWVGYNGDVAHGCGNHLHLSWVHADSPSFRLARWVEVIRTGSKGDVAPPPTNLPTVPSKKPPASNTGGIGAGRAPGTDSGGIGGPGD